MCMQIHIYRLYVFIGVYERFHMHDICMHLCMRDVFAWALPLLFACYIVWGLGFPGLGFGFCLTNVLVSVL